MSFKKDNLIIIIPGLGDGSISSIKRIQFLVNHFNKNNTKVIVHQVYWRDGEEFRPKFFRLLKLVDLKSNTHNISLIGISAGSSMAFNAFLERKNIVEKAINVCGRLRTGNSKIRSLDNMAKTSIAFKQSVQSFEAREKELTGEDKKRLMTIRPFFGDELVPANTVAVNGATNLVIPTIEHGLSIAAALTIFSKPLIKFLKEG